MAVMEKDTDLPKSIFSIKEVCVRLERIYRQQFQGTNVTLKINCEVEELFGNEALIESLLRNLINNAYHALQNKEEGIISVVISSKENNILLMVSDNGCGIAKEHITQIFEPFYRVDKARSRESGGSGLGLAFCKKIVDIHKGNISVESVEGKGTNFIVNFIV